MIKWSWPGRVAAMFGAVILSAMLIAVWVPDNYLYDDEFRIYRREWWDIVCKSALTSLMGLAVCMLWAIIDDDVKNKQ